MSWTTEKIKEIPVENLEQGNLSASGAVASDKYVRTVDFETIPVGYDEETKISSTILTFQPSNPDIYYRLFQYTIDENYVSSSSMMQGEQTLTLTDNRKIKLTFSNTSSGNAETLPEDVGAFTITADFGNYQWAQDGVNLCGFPYLVASGIAPVADVPYTWAIDGNFWGFPYNRKAGIAPVADVPYTWAIDGNFWGFPYNRKAGIAPPYREGFSKMYLGADNVPKLYLGRRLVNRVYRGKVLIFEKG